MVDKEKASPVGIVFCLMKKFSGQEETLTIIDKLNVDVE